MGFFLNIFFISRAPIGYFFQCAEAQAAFHHHGCVKNIVGVYLTAKGQTCTYIISLTNV